MAGCGSSMIPIGWLADGKRALEISVIIGHPRIPGLDADTLSPQPSTLKAPFDNERDA
ncbi:hypothetical protein DENIT_130036 [Pseudomonas veronii]|nr:hypothetical protein DENIT_130036 [Pseudomonas veronii]